MHGYHIQQKNMQRFFHAFPDDMSAETGPYVKARSRIKKKACHSVAKNLRQLLKLASARSMLLLMSESDYGRSSTNTGAILRGKASALLRSNSTRDRKLIRQCARCAEVVCTAVRITRP